MTENEEKLPAAVSPQIPVTTVTPVQQQPIVIMKKEPASNVYACTCGHQWRTSAVNPVCAKCGKDSPRRATHEEKRAFNRKAKKKDEPVKTIETENNNTSVITPAVVSQFSGGDNEFTTPSQIKVELKKPEEVQKVLEGTAINPTSPATEIKKSGTLNFKALLMLGALGGIAAGLCIVIKKKMQQTRKAAPRRAAPPPSTAAPQPEAPQAETPVFTVMDTPAGFC
jgi:DNA-directed RNA polymerase subunit M/transcription elongation factor TFIIS